jgi:hypothetical protein
MATRTKEEKEEKAIVAPSSQSTALAAIPDYGEDAGDGVRDMDKSDASYPFVNLLQRNSPTVVDEKAAAGDYLNTSTGEIYTRADGFLFCPAYREKKFAKWVPREESGGQGGFRGHYMPDDPVVIEAIANAKKFGKNMIVENGENLRLVETYYLFGSIVTEAREFDSYAIIAFWSGKIKEYRRWGSTLMRFAMKVPMYAHLMRFTSRTHRYPQGSAFVPVIKPADPRGLRESLLPRDGEIYAASRALRKMAETGQIKPDYAKSQDAGDVDTDTDDHPFGS